ncbi:hypothetical protein CEXT_375791 [Caerostris extrusa]|uniref:Uncharacterized protein n=1 Tax=Caerostris extrusa TaxID=172846 RepID=A0AAV4XN87_CAEEX|nr:hypothetical protein CEXT_375791 [Caerostris extrusa]
MMSCSRGGDMKESINGRGSTSFSAPPVSTRQPRVGIVERTVDRGKVPCPPPGLRFQLNARWLTCPRAAFLRKGLKVWRKCKVSVF